MSDIYEAGERYWRAVEPIWDKVSIYDGEFVFLSQFPELDPNVGHLFAAHWCNSEVCNGGFWQLFYNSTGVLAPEALLAFTALELDSFADCLRNAMSLMGNPYLRDRSARIEIFEKDEETGGVLEETLNDLSDRYFAARRLGYRHFDLAADAFARRSGL